MRNILSFSLSLGLGLTLPILASHSPDGPAAPPRGIITPIAPMAPNGYGMFVDAAFTWWKSEISGMNFAQTGNHVLSSPAEFRPGFKLGMGLDLDFDGWDVYAQYTWFYQPWLSSSSSSKKEVGFSSFMEWNDKSSSFTSLTIDSTKSSRKEQFNILDLEMGRNFYISKQITLRPFFSIKLARMLEKTLLIETNDELSEKIKISLHQSLSGIGGRGGINTFWHIGQQWGIYGNLALTALWSRIHNYYSSHFSSLQRSNKLNAQPILPILEISIGAAYETWFSKESYKLYGLAGWEEQIWMNYNYNTPSGIFNNTGNLTLHGLTAKIGLAF